MSEQVMHFYKRGANTSAMGLSECGHWYLWKQLTPRPAAVECGNCRRTKMFRLAWRRTEAREAPPGGTER